MQSELVTLENVNWNNFARLLKAHEKDKVKLYYSEINYSNVSMVIEVAKRFVNWCCFDWGEINLSEEDAVKFKQKITRLADLRFAEVLKNPYDEKKLIDTPIFFYRAFSNSSILDVYLGENDFVFYIKRKLRFLLPEQVELFSEFIRRKVKEGETGRVRAFLFNMAHTTNKWGVLRDIFDDELDLRIVWFASIYLRKEYTWLNEMNFSYRYFLKQQPKSKFFGNYKYYAVFPEMMKSIDLENYPIFFDYS